MGSRADAMVGVLVDDLDGFEAAETTPFGWNVESCELNRPSAPCPRSTPRSGRSCDGFETIADAGCGTRSHAATVGVPESRRTGGCDLDQVPDDRQTRQHGNVDGARILLSIGAHRELGEVPALQHHAHLVEIRGHLRGERDRRLLKSGRSLPPAGTHRDQRHCSWHSSIVAVRDPFSGRHRSPPSPLGPTVRLGDHVVWAWSRASGSTSKASSSRRWRRRSCSWWLRGAGRSAVRQGVVIAARGP